MIIDNNLTFSGSWSNGTWTGQTVTGASAVLSTNVLDTNPASTGAGANQPIDLGMGESLELAISVTTAFTGLTALEIQYVEADDASLSTNLTVLVSTGAIPVASLTAGQQIVLHVDRAAPYGARRYVGVRYVPTGTGTAGAVIANMVKNVGDIKNQYYKPGFAVL